MTDRLRVTWPDPAPFRDRAGRPIRILAVSDEVDPSLESAATRQRLGDLDMIIGCGDLEPNYLGFIADAFHAPLRYIRGNHDVGSAWGHTERELLPQPMADGEVVEEAGIRMLGFSGSPIYSDAGMQVSGPGMWLKTVLAWLRARNARPLLLVSHAAPRGVNDAEDKAHRGFTSFVWLADRIRPPLWLHGHTALVRRGLDARCARRDGTLFYNTTGATLVELLPPGSAPTDQD
jgi:uncharacterized protein